MSPPKEGHILVVDDEAGIRVGCQRVLEAEGYHVEAAEDGAAGLRKVREGLYDLLLVDMMMPGIGGLDLIQQVHEIDPEIIQIVITGYASIESTVDAIKRGAYDYIPKPFSPEALARVVRRGLEKRALRLEAEALRAERQRRLLEVASEKTRTRTIISCMADGVLVINRQGQLVLWNAAASTMLRLRDTDTPDQPLAHYTGNEALLALVDEVHSQAPTKLSLIRREIETGHGSEVLRASVAPIRDEHGETLGTVTVLNDITELKEIDTIKSQFVSMVAHELRAPLAAIEGWLEVILTGAAGEGPEQRRKWLEKIKNRAHDLLELVNDLLVFNRMEAGKVAQNMEPLALVAVVGAAVELQQKEAEKVQVTLAVDLPPELPPIRADRKDMQRLFTNLIDNAIKYNVAGGSVRVTGAVQGGFLRVQVRDTGVGIRPEDLPRIYDEFFRAEDPRTREVRGTGLGLAITRKIVESHQGRIEVESKPGAGTTFTVFLPLASG
jgi:two-component system, OmpR family, phosphate regulon sensor histidine kinase PhoR